MSAEIKDKILEFLVLDENKHYKYREHKLRKQLLPELNDDQIKKIINEMISYDNDLFWHSKPNSNGSVIIKKNGNTKDFLEKGGFTKLLQDTIERQEKEQAREDKKDENLDLNIISTKFNIEASKYNKKINRKLGWFGVVLTVLSFVISSLTSGLFSSDDTQSQQTNPEVTLEQMQLLSKEKDSLIFLLNQKIESLHTPIMSDSLPKN
ncbi:hypothetical protein [uncultured Psychroserpens sp.]|uniref:hypothetical protein n=1 Tax=uncultured Psychroserpens sp. TaxID=255436 RepID=UPI002620DC76|nr:hypothetical protein [uncultured Psychroserpens sp.]